MRFSIISITAAFALALPTPIIAQDAAETATIMAGTGAGQARAQRSMGNAVSGSINSATNAINAGRAGGSRRSSRRGGTAASSGPLPEGDALENTDAAAYKVGSGATIRVSGRFTPSQAASCTRNCGEEPSEPEE